jgi:hypothetical protein
MINEPAAITRIDQKQDLLLSHMVIGPRSNMKFLEELFGFSFDLLRGRRPIANTGEWRTSSSSGGGK